MKTIIKYGEYAKVILALITLVVVVCFAWGIFLVVVGSFMVLFLLGVLGGLPLTIKNIKTGKITRYHWFKRID